MAEISQKKSIGYAEANTESYNSKSIHRTSKWNQVTTISLAKAHTFWSK